MTTNTMNDIYGIYKNSKTATSWLLSEKNERQRELVTIQKLN